MRDKRYKLSISDIWYYYKVHFFVILAIIIAIVYTIYSTVTKVEPDFSIDCLSDSGVTYENAELLGDLIGNAGVIEDTNGDGNIFVNVSAFPTGLSSPTGDPNYIQVIQLRMAVGDSALILAEPKIFDMYKESGVFMDISDIADSCAIPNEDRIMLDDTVVGIKIDNCGLFAQNSIASKDLYLSLRTPTADIKKKPETLRQFDYAKTAAQYIIKGN